MRYSRIALLIGLLGLLACAKAVQPLPDKNTNWLKACDADAECGSELACLCGLCSKSCQSDAQCGQPGATCVASGDPSLRAVCGTQLVLAGVCSAECERDSDCDAHSKGLRCEAGLCIPAAAPAMPAAPEACTEGDVIAKICDMNCPGLNEYAFAKCGTDGHYGPCACENPHCGPALDCAELCYRDRCLEAPHRCGDLLCEAGATCDGRTFCVKVLADGLSSPGDMGIGSDGALYFVNTGTYDAQGQFNFDAMLARVPRSGGAYERVREDLNEIGRTIILDDAAYWFNVGDGTAFQVTGKLFFSDQPTSIFLTDHAQSPLVADEDAFYWLERKDLNGPVELMSASRAVLQPEPRSLLALSEPSSVLAQTRDRLYWGTVRGGLWSARKDGSDVRRDVEPRNELRGPTALAAEGTDVYWSWTTEAEKIGIGHYAEIPSVDSSLTGPSMSPRLGDNLALDADHVYWLSAPGTDEQYNIIRTPKTTQPFGNPPQPPTEAFGNSLRLTAAAKLFSHEGFLYVSTLAEPGQGKILRIQLPPPPTR